MWLYRFSDEDHYYRATGGGVGHCAAQTSWPLIPPSDDRPDGQESEELQQYLGLDDDESETEGESDED